jgi:tetratricopeptide (TPR) repeat protein
LAVRATALLLLCAPSAFAAAPGLDAYRDGKFDEAYQEFQQTLKDHPQTGAIDKLQFDSGTAAYKMKEYGKALESFSQALLSPDTGLQSKSHYNLGNTLYQRGETQKADEKKLTDWTNSLQHYQETLKLQPENKEAKENYEFVKKKIEDLKKKKEQPPPSPTPSPTPQSKDQKKDQQKQQDKNGQQDQKEQQESKDQQKQDQSQSQSQDGKGENQKNDKEKDQSQAKNEPNKDQPKAGESPSPTPGDKPQSSPSPSPTDGDKKGDQQKGQGQEPSPTPGEGDKASPSPSPSPGEDESTGEGGSPSPTPDGSPKKKLAGEIKGAEGDKSEKEAEPAEAVEAEAEKEGEMSERQARALLESMKNEEARVQLDERKVPRRVYNDW